MDGETNYESDISESWSLIDINLNDESLSAAEAYTELENVSQSDLKTEKLQGSDKRELEDFVRKCKETNETDFSRLSDSDSEASCTNQGLPVHNGTNLNGNDSLSKRSSDNDGLHDSGDAESIEILDIDDNYEEDLEMDRLVPPRVDHFDFPTYQSEDEESSEGKIDNESRVNSSTVIKRRKRRVNRSSDDGVHIVNSENRSSGDNISTPSSSDTEKEGRRLNEVATSAECHPVYKHYRNNVANTILSLSVGVIFAGVACIAIGHFLGVQDAAETAVELVETLKKLQVENAALQSRLSHLNRALLAREMNSKLELPLNQPPKKAASEPGPSDGPSVGKQTDLNNAALSEIRSSLNSIEWLSRLQNFVRKNDKVTDTEYGLDFNGFGKFLHDQLHTLNTRQEEGAKFLEETDRKISKVLQKIISRLSSSQDHIEKLYEKLIKLRKRVNQKIKRIFPESSRRLQPGKSALGRRVPVTELDLQTMNWNSNSEIDKRSDPENIEPVLYKFPQPESYYEKAKKEVKETAEQGIERINSTSIFKNKNSEKIENEDKRKRKKEKKEKNESKDDWKKKKFKEKEEKDETGKKRQRRATKKLPKVMKKPEKNKINEARHGKFPHNQNVFNQTIYQSKIYPKMERKDAPSKVRFKKTKHSKLQKVLLLGKLKRRHQLKNSKKKHASQTCPGSACFNTTGHWVFKWAGEREEIRRHHTLGDWQFERAKVRKELREDELNDNWQFERAKARKEMRDEDFSENWQFRRAVARENNRNDFRWHRGKHAKYAGKDIFLKGFSWF